MTSEEFLASIAECADRLRECGCSGPYVLSVPPNLIREHPEFIALLPDDIRLGVEDYLPPHEVVLREGDELEHDSLGLPPGDRWATEEEIRERFGLSDDV